MRCIFFLLSLLSASAFAEKPIFVMDLPLMIDDVNAGLVTTGLADMQLAFIKADSFNRVAEEYLDEATLVSLLATKSEAGSIQSSHFATLGLELRFNPATLLVSLHLRPSQRRLKNLSSARAGYSPAGESVASISSFINYRISQSYVHQSRFSATGSEPLMGALGGSINSGFLGPVTLEWEVAFDEDEETPWARRDTRFVIDDQDDAIRYTVGDILYQSTEFQGAPALFGVSVERRYQALQPFSIVTATGQQTFSVERTSRVDVVVNGIPQSTQRLTPGRYNLSDFSFSEGLNDIELVLTDGSGQVERILFSLFMDSTLLKPGISEFSFNAGYRRQDGFRQDIRYDFDRPATSFFYRYGITNNLTAGFQAQAEEHLRIAGAEAVLGTALGTLSMTISSSNADNYGNGAAASLRWRKELEVGAGRLPVTFQAVSIFNDKNYMSLGQNMPGIIFKFQHQARASISLPKGYYLGVSARRADAYPGLGADETGVAISLSRQFGWFNANLSINHTQSDTARTGLFASISIPLSIGRQVRSTYDRLRKTTGLQYSKTSSGVINDWSGNAAIERVTLNGEEHRLSGSLLYTANRFTAGVSHTYAQEGFFAGETEERTRADLSGAVVFADGHIALSRPIYDSFALITRHDSLAESRVLVNERFEGATAVADNFGPAVVPTLSSYRQQDISWRAETLPPGYAMGNTIHKLTPTYKSGSLLMAGSGANIMVMGTISFTDGGDVALKAGTVSAADGRNFPSRQTFTNRRGRFVVQQLEPGTYEVNFGASLKAQFIVPPDQKGYMDLGVIVLGESL